MNPRLRRLELFYTELEGFQREPYDGVAGTLPAWVPPFHVELFQRSQKEVLNYCFENAVNRDLLRQVRNLAIKRRGLNMLAYFGGGQMARDLERDLSLMTTIWSAVAAGPEEGLLILAGKDAAGVQKTRGALDVRRKKASEVISAIAAARDAAISEMIVDMFKMSHSRWTNEEIALHIFNRQPTQMSALRKFLPDGFDVSKTLKPLAKSTIDDKIKRLSPKHKKAMPR